MIANCSIIIFIIILELRISSIDIRQIGYSLDYQNLNMSLNFLKSYLPIAASPKRAAKFLAQKVTIPNPEIFIEKIVKLKAAHGRSEYLDQFGKRKAERNLEVIADFDFTLTKHRNPYAVDGHMFCDALFGAFVKSPHLPQLFKEQLIKNYSIFGPYETDTTITFQERVTLITELYRIQLSLFKKHRITQEMVDRVTQDSKIVFRADTADLLKELAYSNIPLYIISGGISDMIHSMLRGVFFTHGRESPLARNVMQNISIHSNELLLYTPKRKWDEPQLDESIKYVKFRKPYIHSFNKYKIMGNLPIRDLKKQDQQPLEPDHSLTDCLLLGDLVSDIYMSRAHPHSTILSVFYAKEGEFDQRALAEKKFDLIVEADGSHRVVLELVKFIKGERERVNWFYINAANSQMESLIRWL